MNKTDLIAQLAEKADITKKLSGEIVDALFGCKDCDGIIVEAVKSGEGLQIIGFGNFESVEIPEREHKNPQTGASVIKPAHRKGKFKPGKPFKEL